MSKLNELELALSIAPEHIALRAEWIPYTKGDQYYADYHDGTLPEWEDIPEELYGLSDCWYVTRRPVPEEIRRSMAWWSAFHKLSTVDRWDPPKISRDRIDTWRVKTFEHVELSDAAVEILGGKEEVEKNLAQGPHLFMEWYMGSCKF